MTIRERAQRDENAMPFLPKSLAHAKPEWLAWPFIIHGGAVV
jgi:hypothetical protein